jgi:hypothetical protein
LPAPAEDEKFCSFAAIRFDGDGDPATAIRRSQIAVLRAE